MELMPDPDHDVKRFCRYSKCMRFVRHKIKGIKGAKEEGDFIISSDNKMYFHETSGLFISKKIGRKKRYHSFADDDPKDVVTEGIAKNDINQSFRIHRGFVVVLIFNAQHKIVGFFKNWQIEDRNRTDTKRNSTIRAKT